MGGDFATFPCDFQNLTFCGSQPGNIAGGYIFNWPISQWGSRVKLNLQGFGHYQIGIYDQNQQYLGYENKLLPVWYSGLDRRAGAVGNRLASEVCRRPASR